MRKVMDNLKTKDQSELQMKQKPKVEPISMNNILQSINPNSLQNYHFKIYKEKLKKQNKKFKCLNNKDKNFKNE